MELTSTHFYPAGYAAVCRYLPSGFRTGAWRMIMLLGIVLLGTSTLAQSPSRFSSQMFAAPNNWAQGASTPMSSSVGGSFLHVTKANGTGDRFFRFYSASSGGTTYEPNGGSDILVNTGTPTNLQVTGSGKAYYVNAPNTTDDWVFKTIGSGTPGTSRMVVFRVQGSIANVPFTSGVVRTPSTVNRAQPVEISATANAVLPAGQGLYLRYSVDNFATSTVVSMAYSAGTLYTATIPGSANTAGTTVRYYVFTSGSGLTIGHSDADFYTINLQNNAGANYSYVVTDRYTTATAGNWNSTSTWLGGVVPPINSNVQVNHEVTLNVGGVTLSSMTVGATGTLNLGNNDLFLATTGTATVLTGSSGATITSGTGELIITGSGTKTISGTITLGNTYLQSTVSLSPSVTITNGSITLAVGGGVTTNAPTYSTNSTLVYARGGTITKDIEWNTASGRGYPNHVRISSSTTLLMGTTSSQSCAGDLTISAGGSMDMNDLSGSLNVGGNLILNGNLRNSRFTSQTIRLTGNLVCGSGSTFDNNAANGISFEGATPKTISGTVPDFVSMTMGTAVTSLTLASPITISGHFRQRAGVLVNAHRLTLGLNAYLTVASAGFMDAAPTFSGGHFISLESGFSGTMGLETPADGLWATLVIGGMSVNLDKNRTVCGTCNVTVSSLATLNLGSFVLSGTGTLGIAGTVTLANAGGISAAISTTTLTPTAGSNLVLKSSGDLGPRAGCDNLIVNVDPGLSINHNAADFTCRRLFLGAGSTWTANNRTLTIAALSSQTSITLGPGVTFNTGNGSIVLQGNGTHTISGIINPYNISIQGGGLVLASGETISNSLTINNSGFVTNNAPTYASGSTLVYNNTSMVSPNYNRGLEWSSTSGAGYPFNVTVAAGNLIVPGFQPTVARSIAGTFTVQAGASASFGTMSVRMAAPRFEINGTLTMSSVVGGDIAFSEAFNLNTGCTFTPNNRELVAIGTGAKTVGGTASPLPNIALLAIEEGSLSFTAPTTVVNRYRLVPGTTTNTTNLTLADGATLLRTGGTLSATPTLAGSINILYQHSSGTLTPDAEVPTDQSTVNSITMGGAGTLSLNRNFAIRTGGFFVLNSGILAPGTFSIGGTGTYSQTAGLLQVTGTGGIAGALPITNRIWSGGSVSLAAGTAMNFGVVSGLNSTTVSVDGTGTVVTQEANVTVRDLVVNSGTTYLLGNNTLTLARSSGSVLDITGTFTPGTGKIVFASTGGNVQSITGSASLYDVDIAPSGIAGVNFGGITIMGTLTMNPGSFVTTAGPVYATGSTLRYNNGGTYNISVEWTTPHHVTVSNSTLLNIGGSIPGVARFMNGDLTVLSGAAASMNEGGSKMTRALNVGGSIVCDGGLYLSDQFGGDINLGGNLIFNTGTLFAPNSRAITFNGTTDQTIGGTMAGTTVVQFISINKPSGTVILDRDLDFNNGSGLVRFWLEAGSVNFNGRSITATGTGTKTFRMDAGTLITGGTTLVGHGWDFTDGTSSNTLGGTVNFNETGPEDVPALTYGGIILSGSDDKTLLGNVTIRNLMTLAGGAELVAGSNTIAYNTGATLAYQGNGVQYIGAEWPTVNAPTNLEFASDLWVEITASRTVPGTLTFTKGDVVVGANVLTLGTGPSATGTLVNNSTGSIIGNFRRWIPASSGTYSFPVGLASTQRLANIDFTSAPSAGTLTCTYVPGTTTTAGLPMMDGGIRINNLGVNGYWRITTGDGLTGGTYTATFRGNTFLGVNDYTRLRVVKRASIAANWELLGTGVAPSGSNSDFSIGRGGLTTFSEFAVAGDYAENPLPVVLVNFSAEREGQLDRLKWATATEQNAAYFLLSAGIDGRRFSPIARLKAAGTTTTTRTYAHEVKLDSKAADMPKYYRLQQYDLDGTLAGTWFAHTGTGVMATTWALYPNPVQDKVVVQLPLGADHVTLQLTTAQGKVVWTAEGTPLELAALAEQKLLLLGAGMYQISGSYTGASTGFGLLPALKVVKQ